MGALLDIGLTNAAVATLMALGVALFGRFGRRPALTHALWLLVLLKLVAPPLVPLPIGFPKAAESELSSPAIVTTTGITDVNACKLTEPKDVLVETHAGFAPDPSIVVTEAVPVASLEAEDTAREPLIEPEPSFLVQTLRFLDWRMVIGEIWIAGSLLWLLSATVRIRNFQRALRAAEPAPAWLQTQVDKLADRLGMPSSPTVWLVPGAISPLVWALCGSARLLVPVKLWDRLDEEQRSTLLIHELAHLRRKDHWVRALELVATGLFWWHPVVWWARRAMREAEEQCCDAWVVWAKPSAAKAYATALLETVDFLSQARPPLPLAASGIGHVEHLKRRLTMILKGMTPKGLSWAGRLTVFGLAGALLPLVPTAAQDPAPEPKQVELRVETIPVVDDVFVSEIVIDDEDDKDDTKDKKERTKTVVTQHGTVRLNVKTDDKDDDEDKKADEGKAKEDDAKARAELEAARAALREAQANLAKSAKRLAELESRRGRAARTVRRSEDGKTVVIERRTGRGMPGAPGGTIHIVPPHPPGAPVPPIPPHIEVRGRVISPPAHAVEKRLDELEKKLDKLIDELKSQKKDTGAKEKSTEGPTTA